MQPEHLTFPQSLNLGSKIYEELKVFHLLCCISFTCIPYYITRPTGRNIYEDPKKFLYPTRGHNFCLAAMQSKTAAPTNKALCNRACLVLNLKYL